MAAPTIPTNLKVILDCIEYMFNQINNANGYYTDGVLVDRAKDPRLTRQNIPAKWLQTHACITINLSKRTKDSLVTAGVRRWKQEFTLMGLVTLTKDQDSRGVTLDEVVANLQHDIVHVLDTDLNLGPTSLAINKPQPNVTMLCMDGFTNDEGANFPDAHFLGHGSFLYSERTR